MKPMCNDRSNSLANPRLAAWLLCGLMLVLLGWPGLGQDLPAVSDGRHVWLIQPGEGEGGESPELKLYHHPEALKLDPQRLVIVLPEAVPIEGKLMPRGVAAGQGRLVVVLEDRRVVALRPSLSGLTGAWEYSETRLTELPEGLGLRSLAVTEDGVWALVRVEMRSTLEALEPAADRQGDVPAGVEGFLFRSLLGLPPGADLTLPGEALPQDDGAEQSGEGAGAEEPGEASGEDQDAPRATPPGNADLEQADPEQADVEPSDSTVPAGVGAAAAQPAQPEPQVDEPFVPVYRLIHLKQGRWQSHPLPDTFGQPQQARLLARPDHAVPVIVVRYSTSPSASIVVLQSAEQDEDQPSDAAAQPDEQWTSHSYRLMDIRNWSAAVVQGQVVVGIERARDDTRIDVDFYLLRGGRTAGADISRLVLPTNGAGRWAMLGVDGRAGVLTVPGPLLKPYADGSAAPLTLAGWRSSSLDGSIDAQILPVMTHQPTPLEANLDWLLQIITYVAALLLMMMFWRRSPGDGQLHLPERVVLASIDKRIISGLIDLLPGLIIASAIYQISWVEIAQLWPGTPTDKTLRAMRPGLVVIGITVVHTTLFELITARSIGKWLTGLYVSDFRGKPAPPGASAVRSVLRVLDMIALLLLIIPLISPARQRLGDILARTIVVTRLPDPEEERKKKEQRQREMEQDDDW